VSFLFARYDLILILGLERGPTVRQVNPEDRDIDVKQLVRCRMMSLSGRRMMISGNNKNIDANKKQSPAQSLDFEVSPNYHSNS